MFPCIHDARVKSIHPSTDICFHGSIVSELFGDDLIISVKFMIFIFASSAEQYGPDDSTPVAASRRLSLQFVATKVMRGVAKTKPPTSRVLNQDFFEDIMDPSAYEVISRRQGPQRSLDGTLSGTNAAVSTQGSSSVNQEDEKTFVFDSLSRKPSFFITETSADPAQGMQSPSAGSMSGQSRHPHFLVSAGSTSSLKGTTTSEANPVAFGATEQPSGALIRSSSSLQVDPLGLATDGKSFRRKSICVHIQRLEASVQEFDPLQNFVKTASSGSMNSSAGKIPSPTSSSMATPGSNSLMDRRRSLLADSDGRRMSRRISIRDIASFIKEDAEVPQSPVVSSTKAAEASASSNLGSTGILLSPVQAASTTPFGQVQDGLQGSEGFVYAHDR